MPCPKSDARLEKVWILTILYPCGTVFYVFRDEETARRQLAQYARENWETTMGTTDGVPLLDEHVVEDYFEDNERESYVLVEEDVLDDVWKEIDDDLEQPCQRTLTATDLE